MIHRLSNRHTMTRDVMLAWTEILNIDTEHCIWIRFVHSASNDIISIHIFRHYQQWQFLSFNSLLPYQ